MGDFNAFLFSHEKIGHENIGATIPYDDFLNCCLQLGLEDMRGLGCLHTWRNNQGVESWLRIKLDRVMGNPAWFEAFDRADAWFLESGLSDHSPAVVTLVRSDKVASYPVRFLNVWTEHPRFQDVVRQGWQEKDDGAIMYRVFQKLKRLKRLLRALHQSSFSCIAERIVDARSQLVQAQNLLNGAFSAENKNRAEKAARDLAQLLVAEDQMIKQRAKSEWVQFMDRNNKYFYSLLKARGKRGLISSLIDEQGNMLVCDCDIEAEIMRFYKDLLGTSFQCSEDLDVQFIDVGKRLAPQQGMDLIRDFNENDVMVALKSIHEDKAPGQDGYTSRFFRSSWGIVGKDVSEDVLNFFHKSKMLTQANTTIIHLIPKVENPSKRVLPSLVDQAQSGFVGGKRIVDNILLCQELMAGYDRRDISPRCVAKIDIRKAYDSVSWSFVRELLVELGFPSRFFCWIMECITTVTFSFDINGKLGGFLRGERGLRQGDLLSPYVFVLVMVYFSRKLKWVSAKPEFKFHLMCKGLGITNLCFADDLMILAKAHKGTLQLIKEQLDHFGRVSGLVENLGKSHLYVGGVGPEKKHELAGVLGFEVGVEHFRPLIEKVVKRITSWSMRLLSFAGRLQLIQGIFTSLRVYWAQIFLIPKEVIKEKVKCRMFLWLGATMNPKKALVVWEEVCKPRGFGGLGIKKL
ncbi:hypothetical protein Dimus_038936 [Dionaea muscipula]